MKLIYIILISFMLAACAKNDEVHYDPPTTGGGTQSPTKAWNLNDLPITVYIPSDLNAYRVSIENSAETWRSAFGRPVFNFIFDDPNKPNTQWAGSLDSLYDNYFGLFKMLSWNFNNIDSGVLAFTGTLTQTGRIIHADILFNFKNYRFGDVTLNPTDQNLVDYESVLTHELGHFLGLNHIEVVTDPLSIMNPTIRKGQSKRYLSPNDVARVRDLYDL